MHVRVLAGSFALAAMSVNVLVQPTFTTVLMSNASADGDAYNEPCISVSKVNPNLLIVACNFQRAPYVTGDVRRVYYGISTTGLLGTHAGFAERAFLPVPPGFGGQTSDWRWFDPMTAASYTTDNLWVGCVIRSGALNDGGFAVWRNPQSTAALSLTDSGEMRSSGNREDKGMIAVGPDRLHPGAEVMHLGFARTNYIGGLIDDILMWRQSSVGTPGAAWAPVALRILPEAPPPVPPDPPEPRVPRVGFGAMPVVQTSGLDAGKLIMVYESPRPQYTHSNMTTIEICRNGSPELNDEPSWGSAIRFELETAGPRIYPVEGSSAYYGPLAVGQPPCICRDPADPGTVYVAFIGSPTEYPDIVNPDPPIDQNVDIYIAKVTYVSGGQPPTTVVQRLTDHQLGDISAGLFQNGSDQFFPSITVDPYGGLNLAYMRMPHLPSTDPLYVPPVDVSYVRLAQFPISAGTTFAPYRLTQPYLVFPQAGPRIGDYISIDSSGCLVYIAYPKVEPGLTNLCNTYVTRVTLCQADIDSTGIVDTNDVVAFANGFAQGTEQTDMNSDSVHTAADFECFLNAFTCGCAQQP